MRGLALGLVLLASACHQRNPAAAAAPEPRTGEAPPPLRGPASEPVDAGAATAADAGDPGSATPLLRFAAWGDARPPFTEATFDYPSDVVGAIFSGVQAAGAQFVVGTGDYMYAFTAGAVQKQVDLLLQAEASFGGPVYHALGNHECSGLGFAWSNCPNGDESEGMLAFMADLLPVGVTTPYYRVDASTPLGSAKFLFIAANAWSDQQAAWLADQLADPTVYTFAVRHEPPATVEAPGVDPSEALLAVHPPTLALFGHLHEYERLSANQVISGNGGAPIDKAGQSFGFLLVEQQADGTIAASAIDVTTGMPMDTWRVDAAGQAVP